MDRAAGREAFRGDADAVDRDLDRDRAEDGHPLARRREWST